MYSYIRPLVFSLVALTSTTYLSHSNEFSLESEELEKKMEKVKIGQYQASAADKVVSEIGITPDSLIQSNLSLSGSYAKKIQALKEKENEPENLGKIGSLYAQVAYQSSQPISYLLQGAYWHLKALKEGVVGSIFTFAGLIERITDEDKNFVNQFGGEKAIRKVILDLFKLAADSGNEEASLAYKDRLQRYS